MKKKFYRSCVSMLLTMVLIFGGANIGVKTKPPDIVFNGLTAFSITTPTGSYMDVGTQLEVVGVVEPSSCAIGWESSDESVATVDGNGLVTAVSGGTVTITATAYDPATPLTITDSITIYVCDSTGLTYNEYFIMNSVTGRLIGLESESYSTTTTVSTLPFSSALQAMWIAEKQADGRFCLISNFGSMDKYLGISNSTTKLTNNRIKFTIYRMPGGNYEGLFFIKYGNKYLAENASHNLYLSDTLSANCCWSFMKVNMLGAEIYGFNYIRDIDSDGDGDFDDIDVFSSAAHIDTFAEVISDLYCPCFPIYNGSAGRAYEALSSKEIFVYKGHAKEARLTFCTRNDVTTGRIVAHQDMGFDDVAAYPINALGENSLANVRCVLYLGCRSGMDYSTANGVYNLVDETFDKGAHFVLGSRADITEYHTDQWFEYFIDLLEDGLNIESCIEVANIALDEVQFNSVDENGNQIVISCVGLPLYCRGDQKQYLINY